MAKFIKNNLVFLLFLTLIFLRFWKVPAFFIFGTDEEYQALLSWSIVKHFHIIWIGVSASSIGYYLGPGLVYLGALLLFFSKGNPIIFGYFASLVGVTTAVSLYYVVKLLYGKTIGLISFALYIFSPLAIYYDRKYWPLAVPLVAIWLYYSLVKSKKNPYWLLLASLLIAFSYHLHISLWIFWPFILVAFGYHIIVKKKMPVVIPITSIIIFFIITLPLLVFDFVHNFDNLLLPLRLFNKTGSPGMVKPISRLNELTTAITKMFLPSPFATPLISMLFIIILAFIACWMVIKNKTIKLKLLTGIIVLFSLGFLLFPSPMQEYYFVLILPFVIILISLFINSFSRVKYLIVAALVMLNLFYFFKYPSFSDYEKKISLIKKAINIVKNEPFYLEVEGNYLFNGGWRYLFQSYKMLPLQSSADSTFGWIYPTEISAEKPKYKIFISSHATMVISNKKTP